MHFWLRVYNKPEWVQTYYKLPASVGGGEFRFRRPAYVVAPGSRIPEGEYQFVQGSPSLFTRQPELEYMSLSWALPQHALFETLAHRSGPGAVPDMGDMRPAYINAPPILRLLDFLRSAESAPVPKVSQRGTVLPLKYGSRSEAEQALVFGLVSAGWDFDQVVELFDREQPGHYAATPSPEAYLKSTYIKAVTLYLRLNGK